MSWPGPPVPSPVQSVRVTRVFRMISPLAAMLLSALLPASAVLPPGSGAPAHSCAAYDINMSAVIWLPEWDSKEHATQVDGHALSHPLELLSAKNDSAVDESVSTSTQHYVDSSATASSASWWALFNFCSTKDLQNRAMPSPRCRRHRLRPSSSPHRHHHERPGRSTL